MKCSTCGSELVPGSKFCTSCGAKVVINQNYSPSAGLGYKAPPMTIGGWIGRMLLLSLLYLVPVIGWIIDIVLLCVWAGDRAKDDTFRNWAKAQLTVLLIIIGISVVISIVIIGIITSTANSLF
ncbi:MAG: zinc ribbon domain-containing protein [Candidatus Ornithomonoglobus sp.]